ncbi:MAG: DUF1835 domain-containing protein [Pyrinomonadaceae bacterium]
MILHVLPGDASVDRFKAAGIQGDVAVCREALIEGDLSGDTLPEFWENRAKFLAAEYPGARDSYHENVVREFAKLTALQSGSEINLWFEYELFCQTNMWFCLDLLRESAADIFRVAPTVLLENEVWDGFGNLSPDDMRKCFAARVGLSLDDIELGASLWFAYRDRDHNELERLSLSESSAFPKLREVCLAAIDKESRPKEIVGEIIRGGETDFEKVFREFKAKAGAYGYRDAQVKKIWRELIV